MPEFRFLHAADIHLDSPLHGLERYDGAPVEDLRNATRKAFENLVRLAVEESVHFVVLAGDLYDGDWKDYNTGLFLAGQMSRLREAGIRVFLIAGNHDAASQITRSLEMPENVHRFSTKAPETVLLESLGVALHGQGFSTRAVTENLALAYPTAVPGYFNVGILHTCAGGREGHEPYAPCVVEDLASRGYDYWALGHVHRREELGRDPWIVFPGNIQGRHIRETGAKGCTLVTVEEGGEVRVEHRPLDVLRWVLLEIDCSGTETPEDVPDLVRSALEAELAEADGRSLAVRLRLHGVSPAHAELTADEDRWMNEIRAVANDLGSVWMERILFDTRAHLPVREIAERRDAAGDLLRALMEVRDDPQTLSALADALAPLRARLPAELRQGESALDLESPERLRELVEQAAQVLIPRVLMGAASASERKS